MAGQPGGTVHSHLKFIPGRRAAATLAGAYYGLPVPYLHPTYADATATSTSNTTHTTLQVVIRMQPGTVSPAGLRIAPWDPSSNSSHCPTERAVNASYCSWFAIQVNDVPGNGTWWNVTDVAIGAGGDTVVLSVVVPRSGLSAVATSFGWSDWPVVTVYSAEGFPLLTWNKVINEGGDAAPANPQQQEREQERERQGRHA